MQIPQLVERKFLRFKAQPITAPLYEIVIANNGVYKRAKRREMPLENEAMIAVPPVRRASFNRLI